MREKERESRRELALSVTTLAALSRWSFLCSRGDHDSKSKGGRERKTDREGERSMNRLRSRERDKVALRFKERRDGNTPGVRNLVD